MVTPCVGVWIETKYFASTILAVRSHPAWVCGLKHYAVMFNDFKPCHTLRGCVD